MNVVSLISKKRDGHELTEDEIGSLIAGSIHLFASGSCRTKSMYTASCRSDLNSSRHGATPSIRLNVRWSVRFIVKCTDGRLALGPEG